MSKLSTVAHKAALYRHHRATHFPDDLLVDLLKDAVAAEAGPFDGELTAAPVVVYWLSRTQEGLDWLFRYLEYPLPPHPEAVGRALRQVPGVVAIQTRIPLAPGFHTMVVYILKRHEYWRTAPMRLRRMRLLLDEHWFDETHPRVI